MLRDVLTFPKWFYYYAMIQDLLIRLDFLVKALLSSSRFPWLNSFGYATLLDFLEWWRRWIWTILRIETEHVCNFENYRDVTEIPFFDDVQEDNLIQEAQYQVVVKTIQ
jgi:hypothetical protein